MSHHGTGNPQMDLTNYAGPQPYDTYNRGPLNKWKHSGIQKSSWTQRLSNVGRQASNLAGNVAYIIRNPSSVVNEYKRLKAKKTRGGKKKSRKSRKSGKSRKNRKTRSRK